MNTIKSARLDENNENKVIVEHVEDGSHKKKVYETEDPADAMEIVVKINLLLGVEN